MSSLWLILLFAATFLQSRASAEVYLQCNTTVAVAAGETVALNCSISSTDGNFIGSNCAWLEGRLIFDCEWDNLTYVSLTLSHVVEEKQYIVSIKGIAGHAKSSIKVQVIRRDEPVGVKPSTKLESAIFLLCIFIPLIALGILYFLFRTDRGRTMMNATRKETTQRDLSDMNAAEGSEDSLTASV